MAEPMPVAPAEPFGPRPYRFAVMLTLLAVSFLAVEPAMEGAALSYDDRPLLEGSSLDDPGALYRSPESFFTSRHYYAYLPLYGLSLWADGRAGATVEKTANFHVQNVLWHAAASYVVFLLLCLLVGNRGAAFVGALLFAVHPVHVESVAWISGRKDVLSGFLCLVAALLALLAESRRVLLLPALLVFLLACFAKATAIVLPPLLLAAALLLPRYRGRRAEAAVGTWPFFAVALVPLSVHLSLGVEAGVVAGGRPLDARLMGFVAAWGGAVQRTVLPLGLSIDYPEAEATRLAEIAWPGFLLLAALLLFLFLRRRSPVAAFGIAAFFVALLPFNNVFPSTAVLAADRYLYLPVLGAAVLVAWAAARWTWGGLGGAVLVLLCLGLSWSGARRFASDEELWTRTIAARDASALAWINRGIDRTTRGLHAVPRDEALLRAGVADLESGLTRARLAEHRAKAASGLVIPLYELRRSQDAIDRADEALAQVKAETPDARRFRATVHLNKGIVYKFERYHRLAAREFALSAALWSRYKSWYETGVACLNDDLVEEGRLALERASSIEPARPEPWLELASAYRQIEDRARWQDALEEAESRAPEDSAVVAAWVEFWLDDRSPDYRRAEERLKSVSDPAARRKLEAAVEAQRALFLFRRGDVPEAVKAADKARAGGLAGGKALGNLGQVYVEAGRYDDAVACYRGAARDDAAVRDSVARALALKAAAALRDGRPDDARAAMREALDEKPSRIEAGAAPLGVGEIAALGEARSSTLLLIAAAAVAGDAAGAVQLCDTALDGDVAGERRLLYRLRALALAYGANDLARAEDDLRLVVAEDGKEPWGRYRLAQVLTRRGLAELHGDDASRRQGEARIDEAIAILTGLIDEMPDFMPARVARGEARLARGDESGAKADYLALRERGQATKEVCLKEAVLHRLVYVQGGDPKHLEAATNLLHRALEEDPNEFEALFEIGNVYHNLYDRHEDSAQERMAAFNRALLWYRRAMALNPRVPGPRVEWARIVVKAAGEAIASGDVKRAHELILRVEKEAPDVADAHRERVRLALRPEFGAETGMGPDDIFASAAAALKELQRIDPKDPHLGELRALYHRRRGWSFYLTWAKLAAGPTKERARELAVEEFQEAVAAWPDDPENAAVRDRLREIAPGVIGVDEQEAREDYERGRAAFNEGRFADAADAFRQAVGLFPESIDLRYALASALLRAGSLEEAKEHLQFVANHAEADRHPEALYEVGILYLDRGDKLVARPWLERFVAAMERLGRADDPLAKDARERLAGLKTD